MQSVLTPDESVLAWFQPDLDGNLHYAAGLVVLTNQRLLSLEPGLCTAVGSGDTPPEGRCRSWPLDPEVSLRLEERAGVGTLELLGPKCQIARWRYTIACSASAHRLAEGLEQLRHPKEPDGEDTQRPAGSACPRCGHLLLSEQFVCPVWRTSSRVPGRDP